MFDHWNLFVLSFFIANSRYRWCYRFCQLSSVLIDSYINVKHVDTIFFGRFNVVWYKFWIVMMVWLIFLPTIVVGGDCGGKSLDRNWVKYKLVSQFFRISQCFMFNISSSVQVFWHLVKIKFSYIEGVAKIMDSVIHQARDVFLMKI